MMAGRLQRRDLDEVLAATEPLWQDMRGQRVFLTGGTGFVGCWLLETFCHINRCLVLHAQATVLTRNPDAFAVKAPHLAFDPAITLLRGDVRSFTFPDGDFRFVIHAATEASACQAVDAPLEMLTTMVAGTQRVLEFAASHCVQRFLLTSSGAVYGPQPAGMNYVPESYSGAPDAMDAGSVYGEGKRAAELLCALFCKSSGLECAIARCWSFCGPYLPLHSHFAIGNFVGDVLAGRPIRIAGDGTARRAYLYASDLAIWLWTMLFRAPSMVPIHVGCADDVSILELAQTVAAVLRPDAEIRVCGSASPRAAIMRYVPCVDPAEQLLGLRQSVSLEETIWRTADWHRAACGGTVA